MYMHTWTSPEEKKTTPGNHVLKLNLVMLQCQKLVSLSKVEKGGFHGWQKEIKPGTAANCSTSDKRQGEKRKKAKPRTAASCSTNDKRKGEKWKKADSFTLLRLRLLLGWKLYVQSQVEDSSSYLETYSRRAHVIMSNRTWATHLFRLVLSNCDVECIGRAKQHFNYSESEEEST